MEGSLNIVNDCGKDCLKGLKRGDGIRVSGKIFKNKYISFHREFHLFFETEERFHSQNFCVIFCKRKLKLMRKKYGNIVKTLVI